MIKRIATATLLLGTLSAAWGEAPAPAPAPEVKTDVSTPPAAEAKPDAAAEAKAPAPPEPLDVDKLKTLLGEFDAALYAGEQEKISEQITKHVAPHVDEFIAKFRAEKTPSPELIRLMGFVKTDEAKAELRKLLDSPDAPSRSAAMFALGVTRDEASAPRLTVMLDDADPKIARQAAMALGRIGDKKSYEALERRLESKDALTRLAAVKALGLLGDTRATARLEDYLRTHDDPIETVAVLDALNLIAGDNLFRIIDQLERLAGALEKHGTGSQTQIAQAAVTDALDRFIKKAEDQQQQQGQGSGKKRQTSSGQQPGQMSGSASGKSQGGATAAQSSHNNPAPQVDATMAEIQRTAGAVWGNLPPAVQEEVTAALKQELPERYQHLLKVYYKILAEGK